MGFVRKNNSGGNGTAVNVKNTLTSTSTTDALSANQGRVLNEKIKDIQDEQIVQNERLDENESVDRRQNIAIDALFNENNDKRISLVNQETHEIKMDYAIDNGFTFVDKIEGSTLVNLCDQEQPVLLTKYNAGGSGGEVATPESVDCKARPIVTGSTLINLGTPFDSNKTINKSVNSGYATLLRPTSNNVPTTLFLNILDINLDTQTDLTLDIRGHKSDGTFAQFGILAKVKNVGWHTIKLDTNIDLGITDILVLMSSSNSNSPNVTLSKDYMLLEGDYTNKPIPSKHFTGMQSTFESELVTQSMVDSGLETADKLGKYRAILVSSSKNLWSYGDILGLGVSSTKLTEPIRPGKYAISSTTKTKYSSAPAIAFLDKFSSVIANVSLNQNATVTLSREAYTITLYSNGYNHEGSINNPIDFTDIQIEEGTQATSYTPYSQSTKTVYLNSPLLEGDELKENSAGVCYHVHNYEMGIFDGSVDEKWESMNPSAYPNLTSGKLYSIKCLETGVENREGMCDKMMIIKGNNINITQLNTMVLHSAAAYSNIIYVSHISNTLDDFKSWLQANPVRVVYQLGSPRWEKIDHDYIVDTYAGGKVSVISTIPSKTISFDRWHTPLTYLYPSTNYTIQFESDADTTVDIYLGGATKSSQLIKRGINNIQITTPSTVSDITFKPSGINANISKIVITNTTNEFDYFKNMMSTFEDKLDNNGKYEVNVKVVSEDNSKEYATKVLLNSPLLKGDTVEVIDGRLVHIHKSIKRNVKDFAALFNGVWSYDSTNNRFIMPTITTDATLNGQQFSEWGCYDSAGLVDWGFAINTNNVRFGNKFGYTNASQWTNYLANNDLFVIYGLKSYTREDITDIQVEEFKNAILLNSVKEGTMIIDTALPVKTNITYSCNIPSVTTLRGNLDGQIVISDEQDMVAMENSYKVSMLEILTGVSEGDLNA